MRRDAPATVTARLAAWRKGYVFWRTVRYGFRATEMVCSVLITVHKALPVEWSITMLSVLVTGYAALLTCFDASAKFHAYELAWRLLNKEIVRFRFEAEYPEAKLVEVLRTAEQIIERRVGRG